MTDKQVAPYMKDIVACKSRDDYFRTVIGGSLRVFSGNRPVLNLVGSDANKYPIFLEYFKNITFSTQVRSKIYGDLKELGVTNCTAIENTEEPLDISNDKLTIDEYSKGAYIKSCLDAMLENEARSAVSAEVEALESHMRDVFELAILSQLSGIKIRGDLEGNSRVINGYNELTEPTNIYAIGNSGIIKTNAREDGIAATSGFTYNSLVDILSLAGIHRLKPLSNTDYQYVLLLHPAQVAELRRDTDFKDLLSNSRSGYIGQSEVGVIHGVLIKEEPLLAQGINKGEAVEGTYRSLLLGAGSATLACGSVPVYYPANSLPFLPKGKNLSVIDKPVNAPLALRWRNDDYRRMIYGAMSVLFGVKKTVYDGKDYGVVVITSRGYSINNSSLVEVSSRVKKGV